MEIERKDEIQEVFTCGICEEIVEGLAAVNIHSCIEGYEQVIYDENRYFYPQCANGDIVRRSDVNGENINVVESPAQFVSKFPQVEPSTDADEILIAEVYLRKPLWNQNIAIARRNRRTVDKLWQEVSDATKGIYSIDECKRKWKNLRDRFMRIVSTEKLPSGAASLPKKKKWRFYDSLNFLRDTLLRKETASNITVSNDENVENEEEETEEGSVQDDAPKNYKKRKAARNSSQDRVLEQISEALREPPPTITLPPAPVADEVDHFGKMICCQLRQFPEACRRRIMFNIHKMLYDEQCEDGQ